MRKILSVVFSFVAVLIAIAPLMAFAQNPNPNPGQPWISGAPNPYPTPCIVISRSLRVGSTDATTNGEVSKLQRFLAGSKRIGVPFTDADITGTFGGKTEAALKIYQSKNSLIDVGVTDKDTRKSMGKECESYVPGGVQYIQPKVIGISHQPVSFFSKIIKYLNPMTLLGQLIEAVSGGANVSATQTITSFTLVNADSDQDIALLSSGDVLDLGKLPTRNLNIRANTSPSPVTDRVRFAYDSNSNYATDRTVPYTLAGDNGLTPADYLAWTPTVGAHTVRTTIYNKGKAVAGTAVSLPFTVVNTVPTDTISPTVSITAPANGQNVSGDVAISASASDNTSVTKVELYQGATLVSTDTTAPYNFNWTAPLATSVDQSFSFNAKAYDPTGNVGTSADVVLVVPALVQNAPSVTISANPTAVVVGSPSTLTWSSTNVASCDASGAWSGSQDISGSLSVTPAAVGTYTYSITCTGTTGSASASVNITVNDVITTAVVVRIDNKGTFNELYISGTPGNDIITVSQSGADVTVSANGGSGIFTGPFGDIVLRGEDGNDNLTIDSSVTTAVLVYGGNGTDSIIAYGGARVTAVTVSGGADTVRGNGNSNYWVGAEDTILSTSPETAANKHVITAFYQPWTTNTSSSDYVPLTLNSPNLREPTDSPTTFVMTGRSLFGLGPVETDINQGGVGDCYYLAVIGAFAHSNPNLLTNTGADLGDGTYVVQFMNGSVPAFVRVDSDIATGAYWGFAYTHPGPTGDIWGLIYEKAFAYFRVLDSSAVNNTYASIASGWMTEAYSKLGVPNHNQSFGSNANSYYTTNSTDLNNKKSTTDATYSPAPNLVSNHAYIQVGVSLDGSGNSVYRYRNPWGFNGTSYEDGAGYVNLTFSQVTGNFSLSTVAN